MTDVPLFALPRNAPNTADIVPPQQAHQYQYIHASNSSPGRLEQLSSSSNSLDIKARALRNLRKRSIKMSWLFANKRSRIKDNRDDRLIKRELERYPEGYPRISAFIDSDLDTVLFRRFGVLHARALLYRQVELTELEAQLDQLDKEDAGTPGHTENRWRLGHSLALHDGAMNEKRKELMEKIEEKMEAYDKLILRETELRRLSRPSKREHRNFLDFMYTEHPFSDEDERFVYHEHDFVSLEEHEGSWLDDFMHRIMGHCRRGLLRNIFVTRDDQNKTKDPHVHYYSQQRLGILIKIVIAVASTALLLIPIYLFLTCSVSAKLMAMITLIFALIFATAVSVFTTARRQEVFAATAAYCAVLVVFIGNIQQSTMTQIH